MCLFGDGKNFVSNARVINSEGYRAWTAAVVQRLWQDPRRRLVILEVGCGMRIPSIRKRCEELHVSCPSSQSTFIRVNPEFPRSGLVCEPTICIKETGLCALLAIEAAAQELRAAE